MDLIADTAERFGPHGRPDTVGSFKKATCVPRMRPEGSAPKQTELEQIVDANSVSARASMSWMDAIKPRSTDLSRPQGRRGLRAVLISLNILVWIVIALVIAYAF
jgi:hypothetical protein